VRSLLGVDLEAEQLVNLLLGGGPLIAGPHQITAQDWKKGRERLALRNENFEQRLEFAWVDGGWWFAGSSLYLLSGDKPQWLWTIRHEKLEKRSGTVVPTKTTIKRPVPGDTLELNISYAKQVVEQALPGAGDADSGADGDPSASDGEDGDEGWDDEGGWEDDDEGWEEDGEVQESGTPESPSDASTPQSDPIPAAYLLEAGGLRDRGDLCRGAG
jgi:hypothetical protein